MSVEDSRFLAYVTDRYNRMALEGAEPDIDRIMVEALDDLDLLGDEQRIKLIESIDRCRRARVAHGSAIRRAIRKRWDHGFLLFDKCVAAAEELNAGFVNRFGDAIPQESNTSIPTSRRYDDEELLGGRELKVMLLVALHARVCLTATEIGVLLRLGFSEAAQSRARSLYELTVVLCVLSNDNNYEACERYHDSAAIEHLRFLRALNHRAKLWGGPRVPDHLMREAEEYSDWVIKKWDAGSGPGIRDQYGWARPMLSQSLGERRIRFSDLEKLAKGEVFKPNYLYWNNWVHAGSSSTIMQTDFGSRHLMITRPRIDRDELLSAVDSTLELIRIASGIASKNIAALTGRYDDFLNYGELSRHVSMTREAFGVP